MSAKEMFEKNDYEEYANTDFILVYAYKKDKKMKVSFNLYGKCWYVNGFKAITMDLQKVINKQVEELGWNNGNK